MSSLSKASVAIPQVFIDAEDLVGLQFDLNIDHLSSTLQKLSQTISRNAKVSNSIQEELKDLKGYVDVNTNKTLRMVNVVDDAAKILREQQTKVQEEVKSLQVTSVRREDLEKEKVLLWGSLRRCEQFVDEVELGQADRINKVVRSAMEAFVPRWYETVAAGLWTKIRSELGLLKDSVLERFSEDLAQSDIRFQRQIDNLRTDFSQSIQELSESIRGLKSVAGQQEEQLLRKVQDSAGTLQLAFTEQLTQVEGSLKGQVAEVSERTQYLLNCFAVEGTLSAEASSESPLLHSPPFQQLEQRILQIQQQALLKERADSVATLETIKLELETSLADKVGLQTLQDLLKKYRDETLYSNVKQCLTDTEKLKTDKVGLTTLQGMMKDKAERTDLELKVDKSYMKTVQLQMESRIDEIYRLLISCEQEVQKTAERLQQVQSTPKPLQSFSYADVDSSTEIPRYESMHSVHRPQSMREPNRNHGQAPLGPPMLTTFTPVLSVGGTGGEGEKSKKEMEKASQGSSAKLNTDGKKDAQSFSQLLFRTKPEDFAAGKAPVPKYS